MGQSFFTAVFAALAVHSGWSALHAVSTGSTTSERRAHRLGSILHVIMAVDMAAMTWSWWERLPVLPQLVVFGAGSAWYALVAIRRLGHRSRADPADHGPWSAVMHAVMMAAMIWMIMVMAAASEPTGGHHHSAMSAGEAVLGVGVTSGLIVAGVGTLVTLVEHRARRAGRSRLVGLAAESAMSLAMAASCWLMLHG